MFQLTPEGLELIEVAPGIDIERDILAHMDFKPIVHKPVPMDARIFRDEPMELLDGSAQPATSCERVSYDAERNILFLNLEGCSVRTKSDIVDLQKVLVDGLREGGQARQLRRQPRRLPDRGGSLRRLRRDDRVHDAAPLRDDDALHDQRLPAPEDAGSAVEARPAPHIFERTDEAHAVLDAERTAAE